MVTVKAPAKGQIVIPAPIRKRLNITTGSELKLFEYGDVIYLVPPVADPIRAAAGALPPRPSLAKRVLKDRRRDSV